jgi:hypothetical protein
MEKKIGRGRGRVRGKENKLFFLKNGKGRRRGRVRERETFGKKKIEEEEEE